MNRFILLLSILSSSCLLGCATEGKHRITVWADAPIATRITGGERTVLRMSYDFEDKDEED